MPLRRKTNPLPTERRLVGLKEGAAYIGQSYWSFRDLVHSGEVPVVRLPSSRSRSGVSRNPKVDLADLDQLIERSKERIA